jgi:hypothetical protein
MSSARASVRLAAAVAPLLPVGTVLWWKLTTDTVVEWPAALMMMTPFLGAYFVRHSTARLTLCAASFALSLMAAISYARRTDSDDAYAAFAFLELALVVVVLTVAVRIGERRISQRYVRPEQ